MAYNTAQVTDAGNALFAQILANKSSLSIDKIEISNVQLAASTVLTSMTKIDNVVQTTGANGLQKSGNSFIISTAVSNASVTADYQAWVFGIWGSDSANGTSTLIEVITTTGTPDTIPAYSGSTPVTYNYKFATALSNASSISLSMSNDAYATNDTVLHTSGDETSTGTKTFEKIEVSNDSTPDVVLTDGASISLDNGESKFTPANDSTVVHTTGDETINGKKKFKTDPTDGAGNAYAKTVDVNQQLDKKVVDNKDGTEQLNGVQVQPYNKLSDTIGGRNLLLGTSSVKVRNPTWNNIINVDVTNLVGTTLTYSAMLDITDSTRGSVGVNLTPQDSSGNSIGKNIWSNRINFGNAGKTVATITIPVGASNLNINERTNGTNQNPWVGSRKLEQGSIATDWAPAPEDKVNVSDMRKPASDVAGIEEVNAKQDKIGYTPADDSTVAHLSGVNDFDTVPTVNNNPLLLASSLPSDLARTGSDQEFTGKNTFDTAPIDKTTGNPYITKDGVPSDVARTSQQTNFTAGLQSGGVDVATAADLKSVENSAWHSMTGSSDFFASFTCLYKINTAEKRIELIAFGNTNRQTTGTIIDLSSIISGITSVDGYFNVIYGDEFISKVNFSGTQITCAISNGYSEEGYGGMLSHKSMNINKMDNNPFYVYYTGLV